MSTITTAKFWNDVGFVEDSIEMPRLTATLPTPDATYRDLNPSKARMFNEIRIPADYLECLNYSYMAIVVDFNGTNRQFYGWVDDVELISDSDDAPMTAIHWHVDLWRTYKGDAEFGPGLIRRRPPTGDLPPQNYPYRFRFTDGMYTPLCDEHIVWVIVNLVKNSTGTSTTSEFETRCFPIPRSGSTRFYVGTLTGTTPVSCPTLGDVMKGRWDELWGIDPESVVSAFLSPISPTYLLHGTGTQSSPYVLQGYVPAGSNNAGYLVWNTSTVERIGPSSPRLATLPSKIATTDTTIYTVTGFNGEIIKELPWGVNVKDYTYRLVMGTTFCYIEFRLSEEIDERYLDETSGIGSQVRGTCITIPCPALGLTSNAQSSYVYSGQRQYEMDMMRYESDRQLVESSTDVLGTALNLNFLGAISKGVTSTIDYAEQTLDFNPRLQSVNDYKAAHQTNSMLQAGEGFDNVFYGRVPAIVRLYPDTYSINVRSLDMANYGAHVSEPSNDCTSIITSGGPLQIDNLIVNGDIPITAKKYIRNRFAQGVVLK